MLTWTDIGGHTGLEAMFVIKSALEAHRRRLALDSLQRGTRLNGCKKSG